MIDQRRSKNAEATIYRMTLTATVYHVWQERNRVVFQRRRRQLEEIVRMIIQEVFSRGSLVQRQNKRLQDLNSYPM
ncbi:hypothetical protein RND71_009757 [Anisodus tanguticus]|uniref:Uncharacterized protein n=1 Tax=Anisodus tanguticus TaxID=243964 RepID=A0AAE1VIH0_9SOLA|nr:hypothetical protein RND71_009757 [Anisodus tanguticus]